MISFLLNDRITDTPLPPSTTLLDFIRYEADLRGTKIGCREGDCGACTVLIGTLNGNDVKYKSVTSCLTPLANISGKHVVTVEGLNHEGLNFVQRALVNNSGTQCGFCTPGFVTSLCAFAINSTEGSVPEDAVSSVDGNICRCTGYKSIERAAADILERLKLKDHAHPIRWLVENEFIPEYFLNVSGKLKSLSRNDIISGRVPAGGGTDLYVQKPDDAEHLGLMYLADVEDLRNITIRDGICSIGASVTMTELMDNAGLKNAIPGWHSFIKLIASTPVRNIATVAGNIANASPIGDITIMLLALDAVITLRDDSGTVRTLPLKDFYKGYKQLNKKVGEIITRVEFHLPPHNTFFNFEKVSKRKYLDIASVNSAICLHTDGDVIVSAHCSAGGVSPIPLYLKETSSSLTGKRVTSELVKHAFGILSDEISPISDARGSSGYKRLLARQLFFSHFITLFPEQIKMNELI
ncbi:MAG: FAD binding domain-containing protein [Ignavibacteria bacterium]|nr:FAD binding domain-containing protein [Ignavibacteria bacterium]